MLALIILQSTYLSCIYPSILLVNVLECPVGKYWSLPGGKKKNEDAEKTQKASNFTTFVLTVRGGGAFASSPLWLAWLTIAPLQWDTNVPDSRTRLSLHGWLLSGCGSEALHVKGSLVICWGVNRSEREAIPFCFITKFSEFWLERRGQITDGI